MSSKELLSHISTIADDINLKVKDSNIKLDESKERLVHIEDIDRELRERLINIEDTDRELRERLINIEDTDRELRERLINIEDTDRELRERLINIEDFLKKTIPSLKENDENIRHYSDVTTVHLIRSIDWKNTGDMNCDPISYYSEFEDNYICMHHDWRDIRWNFIDKNDVIILGGGGIFDCSEDLQKVICKILDKCNNVISWGCGHNTHNGVIIKTNVRYDRFILNSVRDFNHNGERYVPDVSCKLSLFDKEYKNKRKIGVIEHLAFPIDDFNYDKISNTCSIGTIIKFIGESEVIITNTWHVCYWSILMNKKVILYRPFSTKFDYFKYKPTTYSGDLEKDIENANTYPQALSECRSINDLFATEVMSLLKSGFNNLVKNQ